MMGLFYFYSYSLETKSFNFNIVKEIELNLNLLACNTHHPVGITWDPHFNVADTIVLIIFH